GKFYLFVAAAGGSADLGMLWLVIFAIAMSAVSLYYYLMVLKQIYVTPVTAEIGKVNVPISTRVVIITLAVGVVVLGCAPNLLLSQLLATIQSGF
ncbi:MAG TPA: NADH-quinone oxidoreductase subunit N, partial [Verrucomicrobiae bacterium]|nr:NADH-quinone oxidoreductase subunit N [Verrucomicrobiae bacterium]